MCSHHSLLSSDTRELEILIELGAPDDLGSSTSPSPSRAGSSYHSPRDQVDSVCSWSGSLGREEYESGGAPLEEKPPGVDRSEGLPSQGTDTLESLMLSVQGAFPLASSDSSPSHCIPIEYVSVLGQALDVPQGL